MKRGRLITTFLVLFFLLVTINFVSAISTSITVTTLPNHDIMVGILKPDEIYYLLDSFHGKTNVNGEFSLTYISSLDVIDIGVWVKKDNQVIATERFNDHYTGSPISLEVFPEGYINPSKNKSTQQNETNLTTETNKTVVNTTSNQAIPNETLANGTGVDVSPGITGSATSEEKGFMSKNIKYIIIVLIVLIVAFVVRFIIKKKTANPAIGKEIKVKKLSEVKKEKDYKKIIEDAEKKIDEAKKEINSFKNAEKIQEINRRMIEDQKELKRLRGEG